MPQGSKNMFSSTGKSVVRASKLPRRGAGTQSPLRGGVISPQGQADPKRQAASSACWEETRARRKNGATQRGRKYHLSHGGALGGIPEISDRGGRPWRKTDSYLVKKGEVGALSRRQSITTGEPAGRMQVVSAKRGVLIKRRAISKFRGGGGWPIERRGKRKMQESFQRRLS